MDIEHKSSNNQMPSKYTNRQLNLQQTYQAIEKLCGINQLQQIIKEIHKRIFRITNHKLHNIYISGSACLQLYNQTQQEWKPNDIDIFVITKKTIYAELFTELVERIDYALRNFGTITYANENSWCNGSTMFSIKR